MKKSELKQLIREVIEEMHKQVYNRVEAEMSRRLDVLSPEEKDDLGKLNQVIHEFILELKEESGGRSIGTDAFNGIRTSLHDHDLDTGILDDVLGAMSGELDDPHGDNN